MIYTIDALAKSVAPIADEHGVAKVILFGSYAQGVATEESDVDLLYQREGSKVRGLLAREAFRLDLEAKLGKEVDLIPLEDLEVPYNKKIVQRLLLELSQRRRS